MLECGPEKGGIYMVRRSYGPEQIINKVREAEVILCQGTTAGEAATKIDQRSKSTL